MYWWRLRIGPQRSGVIRFLVKWQLFSLPHVEVIVIEISVEEVRAHWRGHFASYHSLGAPLPFGTMFPDLSNSRIFSTMEKSSSSSFPGFDRFFWHP